MIVRSNIKFALTVPVLLLAVILLLPLGAPAAGAARADAAREASAVSKVVEDLNFSNPASEATRELSASAFINLLIGGSVSTAEKNYVDSMLVENPFAYSDAIPPRSVITAYSENTLTITAYPYSYEAVNGETVTWVPSVARITGLGVVQLTAGEDGAMTGVLPNIPDTVTFPLEIQYTCSVTIPAAIADRYLNYAWSYADKLYSEQVAYEAQVAAWNAYCTYLEKMATYELALESWNAYVAAQERYEQKLAEYTAYEQEMAVYRQQLAAYETYCTALEAYKQELTAYEAAYARYLQELATYNELLPLYETNSQALERITECMATIESVFVYNSHGKQMYATLIGDTVATVVDNKSKLVNLGGCDPKDIDRADATTAVLKELLTQYKNIPSQSERLTFYQAHYSEIRQNFIDLYGSLHSLYNNDTVRDTLIGYNKLERFIEFLSQLYVISSGLDDQTNRATPEDWTLPGRYDSSIFDFKLHTYTTELEPSQIPEDKNVSDPTGLVYPTGILTPPTRPVLTVTRPSAPDEVRQPIEPDPVRQPEAPTPVKQPTAPETVENPGEPAEAPSYPQLQKDLLAAYKNGTLTARPTGQDITLTLRSVFQRSLQDKAVEFYDADGKTLLFATHLEMGEAIAYGGKPPARADTDKYTYRFVGWKDQDGQLLTEGLGVVDEPTEVFYASYEATLRNYTVTWRVDGVETDATLPYGTIPTYNGTPEKASDAQYDYRFVGWSIPGTDGRTTDLPAVQGNVTYEAVFEPVTRHYTVTWVFSPAEGDHVSVSLAWGTVPTPPTPTRAEDDTYLYKFIGWDASPSAVTEDATYTAQYVIQPILPYTSDDSQGGQSVIREETRYIATVPADGLRVDRLLKLAVTNDLSVCLESADQTVSLICNPAVAADLQELGCTRITILPTDADAASLGGACYEIRFTDAIGRDVSLRYSATVRYASAGVYTKVYNISSDTGNGALPFTLADNVLTVKLNQSAVLQFRNECAVTVDSCDNGILSADRTIAIGGETVTLSLICADGYILDTMEIIGAVTGTLYPVSENLTFVMPDEPVTVRGSLTRQAFTVTFTVDGQVISTQQYFKGDTVVLPPDPTKAASENTVYTFTGWSPTVTTVTGDATYSATFRESVQGRSDDYIPTDSRNREYLPFVKLGIALLVFIAVQVAVVLLIVRACKRRRARAGKR